MPKIVDEAEQRRRIRRAAREIFTRRGLVGTGLAHVAAEAGMGRPNLYHYYADKDALVRDMATELLEEEEALFVAAAQGEGSPLTRIERLVAATTELFDRWSGTGQLLLQLWATEPEHVRPVLRRIRSHVTDLVREGQRRQEIREDMRADFVAGMIVGLIDGLLVQVLLDPTAFPEPEALRRTLVAAVRRMFAA